LEGLITGEGLTRKEVSKVLIYNMYFFDVKRRGGLNRILPRKGRLSG
jgi:hypothetical protein